MSAIKAEMKHGKTGSDALKSEHFELLDKMFLFSALPTTSTGELTLDPRFAKLCKDIKEGQEDGIKEIDLMLVPFFRDKCTKFMLVQSNMDTFKNALVPAARQYNTGGDEGSDDEFGFEDDNAEDAVPTTSDQNIGVEKRTKDEMLRVLLGVFAMAMYTSRMKCLKETCIKVNEGENTIFKFWLNPSHGLRGAITKFCIQHMQFDGTFAKMLESGAIMTNVDFFDSSVLELMRRAPVPGFDDDTQYVILKS